MTFEVKTVLLPKTDPPVPSMISLDFSQIVYSIDWVAILGPLTPIPK